VNKAELVKAVEDRLQTDRRQAAAAVDSVIDIVVRSVAKGEKVAIAGFGVFEKRRRNARTARNPRTGAAVKVKATSVPAFRAGTAFKEVVSGAKKLDRVVKATVGAAAAAGRKSAGSAAGAAGRRGTAAKATGTKRTTATKSTAKKSTAKKATAKKATARKSTAARKSAAKKSTGTRSTARKSATKRSR